jgi:hypothetical protein
LQFRRRFFLFDRVNRGTASLRRYRAD